MHHLINKPKPWTTDEVALLYLLAPAARPCDWGEIAQACGHPLGSCRVTWVRLREHLATGKPLASFGKGSYRNKKRIWTEHDKAELLRLRTIEKLGFFEIDAIFRRSRGASCAKFGQLFGPARDPVDLPPLRAIHAAKHLPQHSSLTAAFCGDPLPGRSALDRIQSGLAEPPR